MPAKSKAQQRLFGMAYAVRTGEMERSKASQEVIDIVDSDMPTDDIKDYASTDHSEIEETRMKSLSEFMNDSLIEESIPNEDLNKLEIYYRDDENELLELINHIKDIGNIGHSFEIVVDPENSDYRKKFEWDGDGPNYIKSVKKT